METNFDAEKQAQTLWRTIHAELAAHGTCAHIAEATAMLELPLSTPLRAALANVLAHHHFHAARYAQALEYARIWRDSDPQSVDALCSEIALLIRLKRWSEVCSVAEAALLQHPNEFRLRGSLCHALFKLGREGEARAHGTLCLALKDRSADGEPFDLKQVPVPAFDAAQRSRNVISFSLFGSNEKYLQGALLNARAAQFVYPQWVCRFYVDDSVPEPTLRALADEGGQIMHVEGLPRAKYGTFWRFLVERDARVDRYLIRDCDAVVNVRERVAVDEWIASGRHFHVMRDWPTHTDLMLAGMWGGVAGALPPMDKAFCRYVEQHIAMRTLDQEFLRNRVWPTVRQSVLVHDSQFAFGSRRDFPRLGALPPGQHVGMAVATRKQRPQDEPARGP